MTAIVNYLQHNILLDNHIEAWKIIIKAPQYTMVEGMLYMKGFMTPWLRCVDETSDKKALQETHAGTCGAHEGERALTGKILMMGIYCPDIHRDATALTRTCVECQTYSSV